MQKADAAFRAGYAAQQAGQLEEARARFAEVVRLAPQIAEGHEALGAVLLELRRPADAIPQLEAAARLKPNDQGIETNLAYAFAQSGQPAKAMPHFEAALRLAQARRRSRNSMPPSTTPMRVRSPPTESAPRRWSSSPPKKKSPDRAPISKMPSAPWRRRWANGTRRGRRSKKRSPPIAPMRAARIHLGVLRPAAERSGGIARHSRSGHPGRAARCGGPR